MSGDELSRRDEGHWAWWSLLPLGLGSWAPIYAGVRAHKPLWWLAGIVLTIITVAAWVVASTTHGTSDLAGGLAILAWVGAAATSFGIRPAYARAIASPWRDALETAQGRLAEREMGKRLAREQPRLALEMGIGRPDLPGAHDAGLVDVNHCHRAALVALPGVGGELADRIAAARDHVGGFSSVEDLGAALDLDAPLVEALRERAVFLPG